jgi:hypothetical protein
MYQVSEWKQVSEWESEERQSEMECKVLQSTSWREQMLVGLSLMRNDGTAGKCWGTVL